MRVEVQRRLLRCDGNDARVLQEEGHLVGEETIGVRGVRDDPRSDAALEAAAGRTMIVIFSIVYTLVFPSMLHQ